MLLGGLVFVIGAMAFIGCNQPESATFGQVESWNGETICIADVGQTTCYETESRGGNFVVEEGIEVGDTVRVTDDDRILKVSNQ